MSRRLWAGLAASAALALFVAGPGALTASAQVPARHGHGSGQSGEGSQGEGSGEGHHRGGDNENSGNGQSGNGQSGQSGNGQSGQPGQSSGGGGGGVSAEGLPPTTTATTIVVPPSAVVAPVSTPVRVRAATADSPPAAVTLAPTQFTPAPPTPSQVLPAFPPPGHGGVARALQTAQSYVLLLSLAGAVLMFLGVQGRLDRRDPRIARAPVRDQLEFRDFE